MVVTNNPMAEPSKAAAATSAATSVSDVEVGKLGGATPAPAPTRQETKKEKGIASSPPAPAAPAHDAEGFAKALTARNRFCTKWVAEFPKPKPPPREPTGEGEEEEGGEDAEPEEEEEEEEEEDDTYVHTPIQIAFSSDGKEILRDVAEDEPADGVESNLVRQHFDSVTGEFLFQEELPKNEDPLIYKYWSSDRNLSVEVPSNEECPVS